MKARRALPLALLLVATLLGIFALRNIRAHGRSAWALLLLPGIFLLLSIDEIIQLHEYANPSQPTVRKKN